MNIKYGNSYKALSFAVINSRRIKGLVLDVELEIIAMLVCKECGRYEMGNLVDWKDSMKAVYAFHKYKLGADRS